MLAINISLNFTNRFVFLVGSYLRSGRRGGRPADDLRPQRLLHHVRRAGRAPRPDGGAGQGRLWLLHVSLSTFEPILKQNLDKFLEYEDPGVMTGKWSTK